MKTLLHTMPKQTRKYWKKRQQLALTVVLDDLEFKKKVYEVAAADGRSVNNWLQRHVLPHIQAEVEKAEKDLSRKGD
jgi:hypothetical protein